MLGLIFPVEVFCFVMYPHDRFAALEELANRVSLVVTQEHGEEARHSVTPHRNATLIFATQRRKARNRSGSGPFL